MSHLAACLQPPTPIFPISTTHGPWVGMDDLCTTYTHAPPHAPPSPPTFCDSQVALLLHPSVNARCSCSHCSSSSVLRCAAAAASRPTSRSQRSTTVTSASVPLLTRSSSLQSPGRDSPPSGALPPPPARCHLTGPCSHKLVDKLQRITPKHCINQRPCAAPAGQDSSKASPLLSVYCG